ncbi:hypothetical protein NXY22_19470 [Parabacteroides distasonis]|uniref:BF2992 family fimbrillin-A clan protein n=1 Tax=Parabacteroides distasonis TaxID=823 RepID=UPI0021647AC6|nr:hypothetical protein [Parabacteroides distasonis]UVR25565.1 hypothetical protein NXY22_19470 [Parabacteroides distasonis]
MMKKIRSRHTAIVLAAACLACSCSRELREEVAPEQVRFGIDTRASDTGLTAGTTFRVMAYNTTTFGLARTGTYLLESPPDEGEVAELKPCALDADGNLDATDEVTDVFTGQNTTYSFVFVSPGVKNNDDGSFDIDMARLKTTGCRFVASELPESKQLGPYGLVKMNNKMKECRARIGFDFYKSNAAGVGDFQIEDLRISSAGDGMETVKFYPAKRQVQVNDLTSTIPIELTPSTEKPEDENGNSLHFTTEEENMAAIVPAIYAPRSKTAEILKTEETNLLESEYLLMQCKLVQGMREMPVVLPLTVKAKDCAILPQRNYIYRVVVKSNYISLSVDVYDALGGNPNDWENIRPGEDEGTIGGEADTIHLGTWEIVQDTDGNGWELQEADEQIIGRPDKTEETEE